MFQTEELKDAELARLAPKISSMTMRNIAVQGFGFTGDEVETMIDQYHENKEAFVFEVLRKWRNKTFSQSREVGTLIVV